MVQVTRITEPGQSLLSADDVKSFMQIGFDGEDQLLLSLIEAATARIESVAGITILESEYRITSDCWPSEVYDLGRYIVPLGPVSSISVFLDGEDVGEGFAFRTGLDASIRPISGIWPGVVSARNGIVLEVVAGFGVSSSSVPQELLTATEISALQMYRERNGEDTSGLTARIHELIAPWRRVQL